MQMRETTVHLGIDRTRNLDLNPLTPEFLLLLMRVRFESNNVCKTAIFDAWLIFKQDINKTNANIVNFFLHEVLCSYYYIIGANMNPNQK